MLASWFNLSMLAMESQQAIGLRLVRLASGGRGARDEARLMVSEKLASATHAAGRLMAGDTTDSVVSGYRRKVRANVRRLSKR